MRAYRIWIVGGVDLLVLIAGFGCLISVKYGDASRSPWWLLGIALIGLGAAGAVVTVVMKSLQMETEESAPSDDGPASSQVSRSS